MQGATVHPAQKVSVGSLRLAKKYLEWNEGDFGTVGQIMFWQCLEIKWIFEKLHQYKKT